MKHFIIRAVDKSMKPRFLNFSEDENGYPYWSTEKPYVFTESELESTLEGIDGLKSEVERQIDGYFHEDIILETIHVSTIDFNFGEVDRKMIFNSKHAEKCFTIREKRS
jgi:hypothetical protein